VVTAKPSHERETAVKTEACLLRTRQNCRYSDVMTRAPAAAPPDKWLSLEDIAEELGVPVRSVYAWRSMGVAPKGYKIGKHIRVKRSDLDAWLEQRADQPGAA
jgi:excisionase family DNA binding protein